MKKANTHKNSDSELSNSIESFWDHTRLKRQEEIEIPYTERILWKKIQNTVRLKQFFKWPNIAAVILLFITSGSLIWQNHYAKESFLIVNTENIPKTVQLQDGSLVILNRNSSISYSSANKREVKLNGEAYFKIIKDSLHPFKVQTDSLDVMVFGTQFNVYAFKNDYQARVSLFSGSVKIVLDDTEERKLIPGEEYSYTYKNSKGSITPFNKEYTMSWRKSKIICHDSNLTELLNKLENYYNVSFNHNRELISDKTITGIFDIDKNLHEILKVIEFTHNLTFNSTKVNRYEIKENDTSLK